MKVIFSMLVTLDHENVDDQQINKCSPRMHLVANASDAIWYRNTCQFLLGFRKKEQTFQLVTLSGSVTLSEATTRVEGITFNGNHWFIFINLTK